MHVLSRSRLQARLGLTADQRSYDGEAHATDHWPGAVFAANSTPVAVAAPPSSLDIVHFHTTIASTKDDSHKAGRMRQMPKCCAEPPFFGYSRHASF